jgi:predicted AAA+ superfamily ATPase
LEDTLLGRLLEPFKHSFRKRLKSAPKFYFFDVGVARALAHHLSIPPVTGTSYYGELFESFVKFFLRKSDYFKNFFYSFFWIEV